jgi:broad specificity phosphatase PhoE
MTGMPAHDAYFVRHGETDWNREYRFQGKMDIPLNAVGRAQAAENGHVLRQLVPDPERFRFVASPLGRTRETMELLRSTMGLKPDGYDTDRRLLEVSFGVWEGKTYPELDKERPGESSAREADKWHFVPEDGESYEQLSVRFRPFLDELNRPVIVVTHGGVLRCIQHFLEGIPGPVAAGLPVPQNKVYAVTGGRAGWL